MSESIEGYAKSNVHLSKLVGHLRKTVKVRKKMVQDLIIERDAALAKIEELEEVLGQHHGLSEDPIP